MVVSSSRFHRSQFREVTSFKAIAKTAIIMSGPRQHASLTKDDETNAAAWEAARGAVWGAGKVSCDLDSSRHSSVDCPLTGRTHPLENLDGLEGIFKFIDLWI